MRALVLVGAVLAAGCGADPCAGISGTCVDLTIESRTIDRADRFELRLSGVVSGVQTSAGKESGLPVHIGISLPTATSGDAQLTVIAGLGVEPLVGIGDTVLHVEAGKHGKASVDVERPGDMVDLAMAGDLGDVDAAGDGAMGPDAAVMRCDPAGVAAAPCIWRWQTPLPQGGEIGGIHAFADNDVFAAAKGGGILHRDGTGWSLLQAVPTPALGALKTRTLVGATYLSADHLYVIGYNTNAGNPPDIFHSTNKGVAWTEEALPILPNPSPFFFAMAANGPEAFAPADDGTILMRDANTGVWSKTSFGPPSTTHFHSATMSTIEKVAAGSNSSGTLIVHTPVGTGSWTASTVTGTAEIDALCWGETSGTYRYWGVGPGGAIFSSSDSHAAAWSAQTSPTSAILYGCTASDATHAWAFGASGTVIYTANGGTTWTGLTTNVDAAVVLEAGSHSPGASLTVGGQVGTLIRSTDNGTSWTPERTGANDQWLALFGVSPGVLYAAGYAGAIARTVDGSSWTALSTAATSENLLAVWASSTTDVYAAGANGAVVHSSNGTTFTKYVNPASGGIPASATITDLYGLAPDNVFAATSAGLFRTTDHGASWSAVGTTGITGAKSVFAMAGEIWVGGSNGQIAHSTDGATWDLQPITTPFGSMLDVTQLRGRLPHDLFAVQQSGGGAVLSRQTAAGAAWTTQTSTSLSSGVFGIAVTPTGKYVYVSTAAGLGVSTDEGVNFVAVATKVSSNQTTGLWSFADNDVYAVTVETKGGILHYGD